MCQSLAKGGQRCLAHVAQRTAAALVPRRGSMRAYFAATDAKHFGPGGTPGSTFTDSSLRRLNDVLALAYRQRGTLHGDDRDRLIELGTPQEAFASGIRYLLVHTPGTVGIQRSDGLPDDTAVRVVRSKPGASCSLVLDVTEQTTTGVGTIIIGRHADDETREVAYTAHPGLPVPPDFADRMGDYEGLSVPLSQVRAVYGSDVWLNTRLVG